MTDNNAPVQALRTAAQRLRDAEVALAPVAARLEASEPGAENTPAEVDAARRDLEDAAAAAALGEVGVAEVDAARAALAAAQEQERAAAADPAPAGLRRRLERAEAAVAAARRDLEDACRQWLLEELAAAEDAYIEAAAAIAQAHGRHAALAAALNGRGAKLPNPVALAAPLLLPTIGPASCAVYSAARPNEHGIGANLTPVLGTDAHDPAAEIDALITPPKRSR